MINLYRDPGQVYRSAEAMRQEIRLPAARDAKASWGHPYTDGIAHVEPLIEAADWTAGNLYDTGSGSIALPSSVYTVYQLRGDANNSYRYLPVGTRRIINPWPFRFNSASFNSGTVFVAKNNNTWFITGAQNLWAMLDFSGTILTLVGGYSLLSTASATQCNVIFKASNLWCDVTLSGSAGVGTVTLLRNGGPLLFCTQSSSGGPFSVRRIVPLSKDDQLTISSDSPTAGQVVIKPCLDFV